MKRNEKHKNRKGSVSFRVRQDGKYSHIEVACVIKSVSEPLTVAYLEYNLGEGRSGCSPEIN